MKQRWIGLFFAALIISASACLPAHAADSPKPAPAVDAPKVPTYEEALGKARQLLSEQKLLEAYLAASATVTLDEKRWEAYALIALVLDAQGESKKAVSYVEKALARAPDEKKARLYDMAAKFAAAKPESPAATPAPAPPGNESRSRRASQSDCRAAPAA